MWGNLNEDTRRCLRFGCSDDLETASRRNLPGDNARTGRVARLDQQGKTKRFAYFWPALRKGRKIGASGVTKAGRACIDNGLVSGIDTDSRVEPRDLCQHFQ